MLHPFTGKRPFPTFRLGLISHRMMLNKFSRFRILEHEALETEILVIGQVCVNVMTFLEVAGNWRITFYGKTIKDLF